MVKITDILPDSIASSVGIKKNDILVSINGFEINDVLDYRFYLTEEEIEIEILRCTRIFKISTNGVVVRFR